MISLPAGTRIWLVAERLERGRFVWPQAQQYGAGRTLTKNTNYGLKITNFGEWPDFDG